MARKATKVEINGRHYVIGDWDVDKALGMMVWLTKTFGEGILNIFVGGDVEDSFSRLIGQDEDIDEEGVITKVGMTAEDKANIREAVEGIIRNLDPDEYVKYSRKIIAGVHCGGQMVEFKTHFVGKMGELHQVMFHILRHQYSDFLGGSCDETET